MRASQKDADITLFKMTSLEATSSNDSIKMDNNHMEQEAMVEQIDQSVVAKTSNCTRRKVLIISLLLLITLTGVIIWITFQKFNTLSNKTIMASLVKHENNNVYLYRDKGNLIFSITVSGSRLHHSNKCNHGNYTEICLQSKNKMVKVHTKNNFMNNTVCYKFVNEATINKVQEIENCFNINGDVWYNILEQGQQEYILNKATLTETQQLGHIPEQFWMSSGGVTVIMNDSLPVWTRIQHNKHSYLCLKTMKSNFAQNCQNTAPLHLTYTVCHSKTVKDSQLFIIQKYLNRPEKLPIGKELAATIWTSDAVHINKCSTSKVTLKQNTHNFIFPTEMEYLIKYSSDQLYLPGDSDFSSSVHITPFISMKQFLALDWQIYCLNKSVVLLDKYNVPNLIQRQGKFNFILNMTKKCVHTAIKTIVRDRFKSEIITVTSGMPELMSLLNKGYNLKTLTEHSTEFYNVLLNATGKVVIVDSGIKVQHLPVLIKSLPRESSWGKAGIKAVIPSVLAYSLSGYGFVLTDSVGGSLLPRGEKLSQELLIRWLQTVILMPLIKVPVLPCFLDDKLNNTIRKLFDLRKKYIPTINNLAENFLETGAPIIRPLWWIAPKDKLALTTDTQFLLGDSTLVAPVLEPDTSSRDLYLPPGIWRDELRQEEIAGGREYVNYRASLHELPLFTKTADIDYH